MSSNEIALYIGDFIVFSVVAFILGRYTFNRFLRRDKKPHTKMDDRLLMLVIVFISGRVFVDEWIAGEVSLAMVTSGLAIILAVASVSLSQWRDKRAKSEDS